MNRMDQKIRKAFENATPNVLGSVLSDCQPRKGDATKMKNKTNRKPWIGIASTAAALVLLVGVCAVAAGIIGSGFTLSAGGATGQPTEQATKGTPLYISSESAKQITIQHAASEYPEYSSLPAVTKCEFTTGEAADNDCYPRYEVKLTFAGFDYEYQISAYTGEILSVKKEQTEIPDSTEGPGIETPDMIGSGKALNAALAHARLTEDQLTGVTVTLWEDKGISFYDISFTAGTDHYHYKIDAYTEAVLAFEKEPEGVVDPDPPVIGQIMIEREKAVDIALADAGYTREQVSDLEIALMEENGHYHYLVKFNASLYWYQYELDPYTGEILSRNREKFMEDKIEPPDGKISESLALMFALEHAGLKEEQITDYSCQFDTETGGRYHYDIQFTAGGYRYEYEVHAYSTEILKSEKTPVG